jgi:hypothetical protein
MRRLLKASAVLETLGETNPESLVGRRVLLRGEDGVDEYRLDEYLFQQDAFAAALMPGIPPV